jgi:rhamnopyranosyl-N-acetylglucosaminyl-diphospho-decaprenol beta-1,3/1,4-galactofuranosyltransferase
VIARRVAAVVVTYNRSAALAETLRAARAQTRPPDRLYVVDNADSDHTGEVLHSQFPEATHLRLAENLGPCGGHARGLERARTDGYDAFWLMDDDSPPEPDALEALLTAAARGGRRLGIVGCRGGFIRFGMIRHLDNPRALASSRVTDGLLAVDFALLDGSLVFRHTVDEIGVPRADFFMMMEDVEYPLRATRAGLEVLLLPRRITRPQHLGSAPGTGLWRSYYQSRNHVRMALDFRSPILLLGCLIRQVHFLIAALAAPDHRSERLKLRWRGISDGLRGRMGRRLEPDIAWR